MNIGIIALVCLVAVAAGVLIGYIARKASAEKTIGSAELAAKNIMLDAENKAETLKKEIALEAKEDAIRVRKDLESEVKERRAELQKSERRLIQKEESLDKKIENIEKKEENIAKKENELLEKNKEIDGFLEKQRAELEKVSGYTAEEAKKLLLENIEKDVRVEASTVIREIESKAREEADQKAKEIITGAIQRCAADQVAETTVSVVPLPNDDMKGRIIGREGRNIRAIETLTGVDLIIDDTPEAVILSAFSEVKREIARIALEKLITDGRIHPSRIEEMVEKAEKEVNASMKAAGEQATFEVGIHNFHPEIIKLLGRLKYRTSYGQNVLRHSIEVAHLAGLMASELGLNAKLAKRAGLVHDIGKALDHDGVEGTHVDIGIDVLRKYKETEAVIDAMAAHHGDYEAKSMEAVLVTAADALSAARPGARKESLDAFIKRLQKREERAVTTPGGEKAYAIQAGREIRIIANPTNVKDDEVAYLAREIAKKVESELQYPGQIKVNVVRETRAVEFAK